MKRSQCSKDPEDKEKKWVEMTNSQKEGRTLIKEKQATWHKNSKKKSSKRRRPSYTDGRAERTRPGRWQGQDRVKRELRSVDARERTSGGFHGRENFRKTGLEQCWRRDMTAGELTEQRTPFMKT